MKAYPSPIPLVRSVIACSFLTTTIALSQTAPEALSEDQINQQAVTELRRAAGPAITTISEDAGGKSFIDSLLASPTRMSDFMYSGPLPNDRAKALRILRTIWESDPSGLQNRMEQTTAAAVALTYAGDNWPEDKALDCYKYFRDSRTQGRLNVLFDALDTREKRFVVSTSGNGGYSEGWSSPLSMAWFRENTRVPVNQYTGICWQAPYLDTSLFGDSINGARFYMPFGDTPNPENVRNYGGVCGSLSHYGANATRSAGIMATTAGEPGHCSYLIRPEKNKWVACYSLSWEKYPHTNIWSPTSWTTLNLQEVFYNKTASAKQSEAWMWKGRELASSDPAGAEAAYLNAVLAEPLNYPAWVEAFTFLKDVRHTPEANWATYVDAELKALKDYPEAAWAAFQVAQSAAANGASDEEKAAFMLKFHQAIAATPSNPYMWYYEGALRSQLDLLSSNHTVQMQFYKDVLTAHTQTMNWFGPTVNVGQNLFGNDPERKEAFYQAISGAASTADAGNAESIINAMRPVILAAERDGDVAVFNSIGKLCDSLMPAASPLTYERFSGSLLTEGGIIKASSTSGYDSPQSHWRILQPSGGNIHTDSNVRPFVTAQLAKLGSLSGIVVVFPNSSAHNNNRQAPLKVSISEDGTTWTQVHRADTFQTVVRIPLESPRAKYVKVERDDDRQEYFSLIAIHAYGTPLQ